MLAIALVEAATPARAQKVPRDFCDTGQERLLAPLRVAGIDTGSVDQLLLVLKGTDDVLQSAAMHVLKQRKVVRAAPEINRVVADQSRTPDVRAKACEALAILDREGTAWRAPCRALLDVRYDDLLRIRTAGALAIAADPVGWPIVKKALNDVEAHGGFSADEFVLAATMVASSFDGLESGRGERIRPSIACAEAFPKASERSQNYLLGVVWDVSRAEDAPMVARMRRHAKSEYLRNVVDQLLKRIASK